MIKYKIQLQLIHTDETLEKIEHLVSKEILKCHQYKLGAAFWNAAGPSTRELHRNSESIARERIT